MKKFLALAFIIILMYPFGTGVIHSKAANIDTFKQVAAGNSHSLVLKSNGELWAWGSNSVGSVGNGSTSAQFTPIQILDNVTQIDTRESYSLALKANGELWAWGYNGYGQVGNGTTANQLTPVKIMDDVAQMSAGEYHSMAVKSNGELWAWGQGINGQLGNGSTDDQLTPVKIMDNVAQISSVSWHSLALKTNGEVWAWGDTYNGAVGNGAVDTDIDQLTPVKILDDVAQIAAHGAISLAVKNNGDLWAWGSNLCGAVGNDSVYDQPTPVKIMSSVAKIVAYRHASYAIKTNGELWAWGSNTRGITGSDTVGIQWAPVKVLDNVADLSINGNHVLAVKGNGELWTWGANSYGEVGNGTTVDQRKPVKVLGDVSFISAGGNQSLAIKSRGELWVSGQDYGKLINGALKNRLIPELIPRSAFGFDTAYTSFSSNEAKSFLAFLYNDCNGVYKTLSDEVLSNNIYFQLLTGQLEPHSRNETLAKIAFVSFVETQLNTLSDEADNQHSQTLSSLQEYFESQLPDTSGMAEEEIDSVVHTMVTPFLDELKDELIAAAAYTLSELTDTYFGDIDNYLHIGMDAYSEAAGLDGKIESLTSSFEAAFQVAFLPLAAERAGRYSYFSQYLALRQSLEPSDSNFKLMMDTILTELVGKYGSSAIFAPFGESWLNHIDTIEGWSEYVYQIEKSLHTFAVSGISLSASSAALQVGTSAPANKVSYQLAAAVTPRNADNCNVVWSSSNPSAATVNSTGFIEAKGIGTTTITATTVDGGFTSSCEVTVTCPVNITISNKSKTYNGLSGGVAVTTSPQNIAYIITYNGSSNVPKDFGTYTVAVSINQTGYTGSTTDILTIQKSPITIKADHVIKLAGNPDPTLTHSIVSGALFTGDNISGALTRQSGEAVGDYQITRGSLSLSNNYELTFTPAYLTISDKTQQAISVLPIPVKTYREPSFSLSATPDTASHLDIFTYDSSNQSVAVIDAAGQVDIVGAGTTNITVTQAGDFTYAPAIVTTSLTVAPKAVTLSGLAADNKIYDGSIGATLNTSGIGYDGKLSPDTLTLDLSNASVEFSSAEVGDNISVLVSGLALGGASKDNYSLLNSTYTGLVANITSPPINDDAPSDAAPTPTPTPGPAPAVETKSEGNSTTVRAELPAVSNNNGVATVHAPENLLSDLLKEAKKAESNGNSSHIEITAGASSNGLIVTLPKEGYQAIANETAASLVLNSNLCSVTFDTKAVTTIGSKADGDVNISIDKVDNSTLSPEMQRQIGDRPVLQFEVTAGTQTVSEFNGNVTVSIPYTLQNDENKNAIVVYYLDGDSKIKTIHGRYDDASKSVIFDTKHFSTYAVGYNQVIFTDVDSTSVYKSAIDFIAARGITYGTGGGEFSPNAPVTRGMFLVMMMRAFGIAPDENRADNFADAGNTYYTNYLAAAKRLGIASGVGESKYAPEQAITRQEMFTLIYNTMKAMSELPGIQSDAKKLSDYSDYEGIADWAKEAMSIMVESQIIAGDGVHLMPAEASTRGQMAQVLFNFLSK